jgi:two-component system response regulator
MHYVDILHIEDDPHCVELMQRALGKMGRQLDFHAVADGELALQFLAARERPPRLIVLDLKIPKVTGLQVLAQLRAEEKTRTVPVIVFTSSREPRDVTLSYQAGANSYVIKPLEYKDFFESVQRIIHYWLGVNYPDEG